MIPQSLTSPPSLKSDFSTEKNILNSSKTCRETETEHDVTWSETKVSTDAEESIVQWKQKNIKDGFVIVDEAQLSKLIKREPIEKYYKLEKEPFAKGVFASVRKCQSLETGESYAAKFTSRDRYGEDCSGEIYHEIALLSLCGSAPRVIQIHDVFETLKEIIIVMEYAPGGDLQTIIDENLVPYEEDVMSFVRQTVEGLDYLHRRKIAHLDIKPQNIVMMGEYPKCEIKLCDFEISRVILEGKDIRELLGTPDYVAPEILHYEPITLAADMWSLGVTTYVLLTGYSPFGGETDQETFCNISRGEVDFPMDLFKDVSNEAIDFVRSLLLKNPKARLTASECLKHAWLNSKPNINKIDAPKPLATLNIDLTQKENDSGTEMTAENNRTVDGSRTKENAKKEPTTDGALRKYLSKSRESLFETVVQKHNNYNLKKNTIKNNRFRKIRMCKSQISLISKSQERLMGSENLNALPSRSIEKLYGLRSLSKSQEVLNLYKTGGLLASQDNLNLVSEIIKSRESLVGGNELEQSKARRLMRATTADLGVLHQRNKPSRMNSCSSTTSLYSVITREDDDDEEDEDDEDGEERGETKERKDSVFSTSDAEDSKCSCDTEPKKSAETNSIMKEIEKLENRMQVQQGNSTAKKKDEDEEEEEPRFTVAQLITAYNKHQEIVTKTSLEVTMSAHEKKIKIPPIIPYKSKSTFPTGPTALRLFIPDIDLVSMPKKFVPKYKMRFPEEKTITKDKNLTPKEPEPVRPLTSSQISLTALTNCNSQNNNHSNNNNNNNKTSSCYLTQDETTQSNRRKSEANLKYVNQDNDKSSSFTTHQRRNKSTSPGLESSKPESIKNAASDTQKTDDVLKRRSPTPSRKPVATRSVERSPSVTRKPLTVERSPVPQRKTCGRTTKTDEPCHKRTEPSSQYKIVGERNAGKKSSGLSYKIEFDSPVVKRKFPTRHMNLKGTISSNLKMRETVHRARK